MSREFLFFRRWSNWISEQFVLGDDTRSPLWHDKDPYYFAFAMHLSTKKQYGESLSFRLSSRHVSILVVGENWTRGQELGRGWVVGPERWEGILVMSDSVFDSVFDDATTSFRRTTGHIAV